MEARVLLRSELRFLLDACLRCFVRFYCACTASLKMRASIVSSLAFVPSLAFALPTSDVELLREIVHRGIHSRCGPVSAYYGQTPADWINNNLDSWLNDWWNSHLSNITAGGSGFAGVWGLWALGNPDWTCQDDGSDSSCDFDPCDNRVLNDKGDDIREAYYVLESITRLHSYFAGLSEAFEVSALFTALSKDSWATTFYKDKDVKSVGILREILNAVSAIVGIGSAFAGLAGSGAGAAGSALSALFTGGVGAATPLIGQQYGSLRFLCLPYPKSIPLISYYAVLPRPSMSLTTYPVKMTFSKNQRISAGSLVRLFLVQ